eukprot:Em0001g733a
MKADKPTQVKTGYEVSVKSPTLVTIPSIHDLELYMALQPILDKFELIWELVLTNQPIVVMATSPTVCSNMVQALVSLIHPLTYAADYRPFFTIHDTEFKNYTTRTQTPPQVILGVTNPFFAKALDHWPHIIKAGDHTSSIANGAGGGGGAGGKRPLEALNVMIKKQALQLTTGFIAPLPPPQLAPFNVEQFLHILEGLGTQIMATIKGNWIDLYRNFLTSPNFVAWYNARKDGANQKLRLFYLDMFSKADIRIWLQGKTEAEVVDLYLQVKYCLTTALKVYPSVPSSLHQDEAVWSGGLTPLPQTFSPDPRPQTSTCDECVGDKTQMPSLKEHGEELRDAARRGDLEEMVRLLNQGADINGADEDGCTALMVASRGGHLDCVMELLEKGALVNDQNTYGSTALMLASGEGRLDCVKELLEKGALVNAQETDGGTALMRASYGGHLDCVKELLEKGALVNAQDKVGRTALMMASDEGHLDCVKELLEKGALVNAQNTVSAV